MSEETWAFWVSERLDSSQRGQRESGFSKERRKSSLPLCVFLLHMPLWSRQKDQFAPPCVFILSLQKADGANEPPLKLQQLWELGCPRSALSIGFAIRRVWSGGPPLSEIPLPHA